MQKLLLAFFIAIGIIVVPLTPRPAAAQTPIADIIAQYPDGGPGLRAAIAAYLEQYPDQAQAVIAAATCASPAQQQATGAQACANAAQQLAIGAGFADASIYFAKIGTAFAMAAQAELVAAMESVAENSPLAAAFAAAIQNGPTQTLYTTIQNLLGTTAPIAGCTGNVHCVSQ